MGGKSEQDHEMSEKTKDWLSQFTDWAVKLMIVAIFGFGYNLSKKQDELITQMVLDRQSNSSHVESIKMTLEHRISTLEKDTQAIKSTMISRMELLEILKRVEQALQIVLLQSGIKHKVDLTSEADKK